MPVQVSLYLLLMGERYGVTLERGLLWYLGQAAPEIVRAVPGELSSLLAQRNRLAAALAKPSAPLPPLLREPGICAGCFQLQACALCHKVGLCCHMCPARRDPRSNSNTMNLAISGIIYC